MATSIAFTVPSPFTSGAGATAPAPAGEAITDTSIPNPAMQMHRMTDPAMAARIVPSGRCARSTFPMA
jgi:hypothetical protein